MARIAPERPNLLFERITSTLVFHDKSSRFLHRDPVALIRGKSGDAYL